MRLAKGFFLLTFAAKMGRSSLPSAYRRATAGHRAEVLWNSFLSKFVSGALRDTSYSRMRLAKGFFLPLIAAGMRSKFCRPTTSKQPASSSQQF